MSLSPAHRCAKQDLEMDTLLQANNSSPMVQTLDGAV